MAGRRWLLDQPDEGALPEFPAGFDVAMRNLEWDGLQPPQVRIDPILLVKQGYIPPNLTTAVVRQEYFETGFRWLDAG